VAWGAFANGTLISSGRAADVSDLSSLASRIEDGARVVAVLPGEQVAVREFAAPQKQSGKLIAAASLLLEDELAEPVADLHIIVTAGEPRAALAVSRSILSDWLTAFDAAGVALTEITVDCACIGGASSTIVFVADNDRVIASRGASGFAVEHDLAMIAAPAFVEAAGDAAIIAYGPSGFVAGLTARPVEYRKAAGATDILSIFAAALSSRPAPPNFLQGAFRRRSPQAFRIGPYRRAGLLAAGLGVAALVSAAAAGVKDARIAGVYEQSASAMHRAAFPTYSGGDIRAHARQMLSSGAAAASFLVLSARLTASLEGNEGVAIDRIRYDGARGQYLFSIRSKSDAGIEAFRSSLEANRLAAADSGGYRRSGEAWIGEMSVKAK
jgi:type II secretion system protein L